MKAPERGFLQEVNIKSDLPTVDTAIRRVTWQIHNSRAMGAGAVKLIHGYGSTGRGGRIRTEMRRYLESQKRLGTIRDYICGEDFSIFGEATRSAFARCGALRHDRDLDRSNNGVTIIVF